MIGTVLRVAILRLWNTKQELLLIFVVPILFFSIFALIFSKGVGHKPKQVRISIVNDDPTLLTKSIVRDLLNRDEVRRVTGIGNTSVDWPIEKLSRVIISNLNAEIVVYFPKGYAGSLATKEPKAVRILSEGTNPISSQVVEATLAQTIAMRKRVPGNPIKNVGVHFASVNSPATGVAAPSANGADEQVPSTQLASSASLVSPSDGQMRFDKLNVFASNKHEPKVAMYAAGIAVMFLLFSSSGAGASLLEEREAGTLERLLSSRMSITQLLIGKWLYIALLGFVQITTMFVWGQLVFSVDLLGHLPGFIVMATATTCASASFALFLASVCRSRNQLNGVSLVVVLGMSALGGSMIPRYIMSESMQELGKYTFNGWALDGFKKIFWYDMSLHAIRVEVFVLVLITIVFATATSVFVRRWSLV